MLSEAKVRDYMVHVARSATFTASDRRIFLQLPGDTQCKSGNNAAEMVFTGICSTHLEE